MTSFYFIVNPISGRGAGAQSIEGIREQASRARLDFEIVTTERPGHAIDLARSASQQGREVVVAVGGDGTANEVLNGLMQARISGQGKAVLGILAVGRGNDFAYGLGIHAGLEEGFKNLTEKYIRSMDVGRVMGGLYPQGRYFGNGVGIGFDAVVGFEALKLTHLSGFLSYIVAALKTIFLYYTAPLVSIVYDDKILTIPALMVSVMNGRRMGGGFMMAPKGKTDDGLFDLCIAGQVSRLGIFALIPKFMQGTQASHPAVKMVRAKTIKVTAIKGVLPAHADGETLCVDGQELEIEMLPSAIEFLATSTEKR